MAPFEDSIRILGQAFIFLGCAAVVAHSAYRLIRYGRISHRSIVITSMALIPIFTMIIAGVIEGNIDVNPLIRSKEQLIGRYSSGDKRLKLNSDGTFVASGLFPITLGTWRNNDWNLTLSGTNLKQARVVTRNGLLCIAPFYAEVDQPIGILLKKENDHGADRKPH